MQDDMRGIFWLTKQQKFMVRIQSSGVRYTVGYYRTLPEARKQRNIFIETLVRVPPAPEKYSPEWFTREARGQALRLVRYYHGDSSLTKERISYGLTVKLEL